MATYYIAPTTHATTPGNDTTGTGTSLLPWATFSKAHTSGANGDTIICKDGSFSFSNQTVSKALTIQAEHDGLAIFDGAGGAVRWTVTATSLTLTGLIFEDVVVTGDVFRIDACPTLTATRCTFRSINTQGALAPGNRGLFCSLNASLTRTMVFTACVFDDLIDSNTSTITFDFIFGFQDQAGATTSLSLLNCVFYLATAGATSKNNLIRGYQTGTVNVTLKNTIVANFNGEAVTLTSNAGTTINTTATYCDFYNITSAPAGTGNITGNPLFIDAANDNFNLRPTSPCINTGTLV